LIRRDLPGTLIFDSRFVKGRSLSSLPSKFRRSEGVGVELAAKDRRKDGEGQGVGKAVKGDGQES